MASSVALKTNYRCGQSLKQFYGGGPFVVSSDGSFIACACGEAVNIVDSSNASIKSTIEADSDTVTALILSPDDKLLFTAGHSRQIKTWDMEALKCIRSWKGHDGPVMGMSCHASGGSLATAGADRKVLVWDVDGGFCTHYFKGHKGVVSFISPNFVFINLESRSSAPALKHEEESPPEEPKQKASSKKRKSRKSGDGSHSSKKVKEVAYTVKTISLQA